MQHHRASVTTASDHQRRLAAEPVGHRASMPGRKASSLRADERHACQATPGLTESGQAGQWPPWHGNPEQLGEAVAFRRKRYGVCVSSLS